MLSKLNATTQSISSMIKPYYGDGFAGLKTFAPFDKILITAAAPEIPAELINQLKTDGQMVIPLDDRYKKKTQVMLRITKLNEGEYKTEEFDNFSFVPMLKGKS